MSCRKERNLRTRIKLYVLVKTFLLTKMCGEKGGGGGGGKEKRSHRAQNSFYLVSLTSYLGGVEPQTLFIWSEKNKLV